MKKFLFALSIATMPLMAFCADQTDAQNAPGKPAADINHVQGGGKPLVAVHASAGMSMPAAGSAAQPKSANAASSNNPRKLLQFNPKKEQDAAH